MSNVLQQLLRWTPISVIIVLFAITDFCGMLWYTFHFMSPPQWMFTAAFSILTGSAVSFGNAQGSATSIAATNVANANNSLPTPSVKA